MEHKLGELTKKLESEFTKKLGEIPVSRGKRTDARLKAPEGTGTSLKRPRTNDGEEGTAFEPLSRQNATQLPSQPITKVNTKIQVADTASSTLTKTLNAVPSSSMKSEKEFLAQRIKDVTKDLQMVVEEVIELKTRSRSLSTRTAQLESASIRSQKEYNALLEDFAAFQTYTKTVLGQFKPVMVLFGNLMPALCHNAASSCSKSGQRRTPRYLPTESSEA